MATPGATPGTGALITPGGAQGPTGTSGTPGAPGAAATIAAGTATGLPAGSSPTVSNSGSSSAAVFNFGIPAGAVGAAGSPGSPGAAGANSWTLSTANFTVPAVGASATINVADTSWAVVGEYVWVQDAVSVGVPLAMQITAKTPTTLTLLNPPTAGNQPSGDPGNLITVGSDSLLYLPPSAIQPTIWSVRLRSFNAVGNPTFEVDQRNTGQLQTNVTNNWGVDRWIVAKTGATATVSTQQTAGNVVLPGTNFLISRTFLRITLTAAQASLAATDRLDIRQSVEGPQLREWINDVSSVSLLVRSSIASLKFGFVINDAGSTYTLPKLCTTSSTANTWSLITLPNLPIPSSGSFPLTPANFGCVLGVSLAAGSTYTASANDVWINMNAFGANGQSNFFNSSVNSTFDLAFVQHEPGPLCTTLIDCPFGANYDGPMGCMRYYQKSYDYGNKPGTGTGSGALSSIIPSTATTTVPGAPFQKPMARVPTGFSYATDGTVNACTDIPSAGNRAVGSVSVGEKAILQLSLTAAAPAQNLIRFQYVADTGW